MLAWFYDNNRFIPLPYAIINGQVEIVKELYQCKATIYLDEAQRWSNYFAFMCRSNYLEGIKLLIETFMNTHEEFLNTIDDKENTILDLSMILRQREVSNQR